MTVASRWQGATTMIMIMTTMSVACVSCSLLLFLHGL